jgi:hypothetical protein
VFVRVVAILVKSLNKSGLAFLLTDNVRPVVDH